MGYKLVIAEKPDMGRKIAMTIGASNKKNGYMEGNGYLVTWAIGHLYGLAEPDAYDKRYEKWVLADLPIMPETMKLKMSKGKNQQVKVIKELIGKADSIVNATDAGREGELIYRYITQALKVKKSIPQFRLWISSLTPEAIKRGFQQLKPLSQYDNLAESARLRSEADWLVGMNGSRAFSIKFGNRGTGPLSIGRVQTPTLAMIYDRVKAIEDFSSATYFEVFGYFNQEGNEYRGKWQGDKIVDKTIADRLVEKVNGKQGEVTKVESTDKKEYAPRLYSLSLLQRDASAKFKFSAKKTLDVAQMLYEKRDMISYPRTSSQFVTKDEIPMMQGVFKKLENQYPQWSHKANTKLVHVNNKLVCDESKVTDHHAIIPTGKTSGSLTPDEKKLYELILQRFFMQFFPPAIYKVHEAITVVLGEEFKTTFKEVLDLGWKANFSRQEESDEGDQGGFDIQKKPAFCDRAEAEEKQTQPPKHFTEGTLITALKMAGNTLDMSDDENKELKEILHTTEGIGTEATRAGIIETLKRREYISVEKNKVVVTDKGRQLIETIRKTPLEILTSPTLTAKWEKALNSIAEGRLSSDKFNSQIRLFSSHIVKVVNEQADGKIAFAKVSATGSGKTTKGTGAKKDVSHEPLGTCPKCKKGQVVENQRGYGCNRWREGCKFVVWKMMSKKKITPTQVKQLITKGKTGNIAGFKYKSGKETFSAYLELDSNHEVVMKKV